MNDVRKAIYARLSTDGTLTALAPGGVHYGVAPQGTLLPYITMLNVTGIPSYTFGGTFGETEMWLIKGLAEDDAINAKSAIELVESIRERIAVLLHDHSFALTSGTLTYLRREDNIPDYPEPLRDGVRMHGGSYYRVERES